MSATARLLIALAGEERATSDAIGSPSRKLPHNFDHDQRMSSGTSANEADQLWSDEITVTDTPQTIDVRALVSKLTGGALTMAEVTGLALKSLSTTSGEWVDIDSGGANPLTSPWVASGDGNKLDPGGVIVLTSPIDGFESDATHKTIRATAATGKTVIIQVWIQGRSA